MAKAIPEGFSTITPSLVLQGAGEAIELYKKAFGAQEEYSMKCPETGKIMHACLQVGSSKLFVADATPECGMQTQDSSFYLYVDNVDAALKKAKQAGLQETMPAEDMFWGDRLGAVKDKFGISWSIATHIRDVSDADMKKGRDEWIAKMKNQKKAA